MKIGKNKFYGLSRWYISIDGSIKHYYCKYEFFRELSKLANEIKPSKEEIEKLNKILKGIM